MSKSAVFSGLIIDEAGNLVDTTYVGNDPCYVVNDSGFKRHIPSDVVDRQVLNKMAEMIEGNEGLLSEQAAKMLGQEDIFTRAMIESQLKQMDQQIERVLEVGIPEEGRAYMGMTGFRIMINVHGDVIKIDQPGIIDSGDE